MFLARLLMVYGIEAPEVLRQMADEPDRLAAAPESREVPPEPGTARPTRQ